MFYQTCFYFCVVYIPYCCFQTRSAEKPHPKSTKNLNPLTDFFLSTLAGYDSSLHIIVDINKGPKKQKLQLNHLIQTAYRLTQYVTLEISILSGSELFHQYSHSHTSPQTKNELGATRKYPNSLVVYIYLCLHSVTDFLWYHNFNIMPQIILFYCEALNISDVSLEDELRLLRGVPLTSIFIAIPFSYSYLSIVCFTCERDFEIIEGNIRYDALLSKWDNLHKNLQTGQVDVHIHEPDSTFDLIEASSCNTHVANLKMLRTFEDLCIHRIAQQILNYTFSPHKELASRHSEMHGFVDTQLMFDSRHVAEMQQLQFEITGHGMIINPYVFFTILNQLNGPVFAILRPFDIGCWIAVGAVLVTFSAILFLMPLVAKKLSFAEIIFTVFGTILEQPANTVNKIFKISGVKPLMLMVAWTLWSTMVIQGRSNYKGNMVSLLTKKKTPDEPSTLQELLDSKLPLITRDGDDLAFDKVCSIRDLHLKDILNSMKKPIPDSNKFKKLHDSIKWMDPSLSKFENAVAFQEPFRLIDKHEFVDFSKTFAIIETSQEAGFRHRLLNGLSDKWISKIYPLSQILISRQMTAVRMNSFGKYFIQIFSSVEAAGLCTRWASFAWNVGMARMLNQSRNRVNNEATKAGLKYRVNLPQNIFGFVFANADIHLSHSTEGEIARSLIVHKATFFLLFVLLAICNIVFIFEVASQYNFHCHCQNSANGLNVALNMQLKRSQVSGLA